MKKWKVKRIVSLGGRTHRCVVYRVVTQPNIEVREHFSVVNNQDKFRQVFLMDRDDDTNYKTIAAAAEEASRGKRKIARKRL